MECSKVEIVWNDLSDKDRNKVISNFLAKTKLEGDHRIAINYTRERVPCCYINNNTFRGEHISLLMAGRKLPLPHERYYRTCGYKQCLNSDHIRIKTLFSSGYPPTRQDWDHAMWMINSKSELVDGHRIWKGWYQGEYGRDNWFGEQWMMHRLSLIASEHLAGNSISIDDDIIVRHGKGCPKGCVEPTHLSFGTHKDNATDRIRDGTRLYKEKNHKTKLTQDIANQIRENKNKLSAPKRAALFDVSSTTIYLIDHNKRWVDGQDSNFSTKRKIEYPPPTEKDYAKWGERIRTLSKNVETDADDPAISLDIVHHITTSKLKESGYSQISIRGDNRYSHRVSLECKLQRSLDEKEVCRHMCKRKDCVNPLHLDVGTHKDNARDKIAQGTAMVGDKSPRRKVPTSTIIEIKKLYEDGTYTISELAKIHDVWYGTIKTWVQKNWE